MKVGEFARRARASRLSKKAKFEAAFERARRDLRLLDAAPVLNGGSANSIGGVPKISHISIVMLGINGRKTMLFDEGFTGSR